MREVVPTGYNDCGTSGRTTQQGKSGHRQGGVQMSSSPVTRCIAVAGHGKRCQQSPFRGSPYCWHHLQSRKVPAPSRPFRVTSGRPTDISGEPATLAVVDRMALAVRLAHGLGAAELAELVRFVEDRRDGTLVMLKESGNVTDIQLHRRPRVSEAR